VIKYKMSQARKVSHFTNFMNLKNFILQA